MDDIIEKYFMDNKTIYFGIADVINANHHLSYYRNRGAIILSIGSDEGEVDIGVFWKPEELEHCIKHIIYNSWKG